MRMKDVLAMTLLALAAGFLRPCVDGAFTASVPSNPQRIVSLSPSVTESLHALGLWPKVVGVTSFCAYPPDADSRPRVGGFGNINIEAVIRASADLAVIPVDQKEVGEALRMVGIPVMTFDTRSLGGFLHDIVSLGDGIGKGAVAREIAEDFRRAAAKAGSRAAGRPGPRVLFAVMHSYEDMGSISDISIIGRDGFYDELIRAAGGVNAYKGRLAFPRLSREAVMHLDPDVIIDVVPVRDRGYVERIRSEWLAFGNLSAVKGGRLHLMTDMADTVPGPRSVSTLEKLSKAFFPEGI